MTADVERYQKNKAPLIPVSINIGRMVPYYKNLHSVQLDSARNARGWTNFYSSDDLSAVSNFYLETPVDELPATIKNFHTTSIVK